MANPLYDTIFGRHAGQGRTFLHLQDGREIGYDGFLAMAAKIAHALSAAGLRPGDRLAAQVAKSPEALALYAACVQGGFVFLPLNTAYTTEELSYFVEDSGARILVCDPGAQGALAPLCDRLGAALLTLGPDGSGTLMQRAGAMPENYDTAARSADDLAAFLYTSGTTGRSKGAMLTQDNLLSNAGVLVDHWRFTEDDVLLHALPIFHTHGLFVATNTLALAGGSMIFLPKFDLDRVIELMPRATTMMGVPTFYTRLLGDERFTAETARNMRLFISGSAPLLAETHLEFEARTGHRILERYGMTETNMSTSNPHDGERRAGTVGFPLPGVELKITGRETGEPLPQGEVGIIEVRGRNVFKGYWQMPEKTAAELRADGFFITGDLGRIDADGYVTIVGRDKDLIISGGYNIYPKEIELLLDAQPGVLESAVIGVKDADFGEAVLGVLVPKPGARIDTDAVMAAMQGSLARFKQPRRLEIVGELPRNAMGKVQKNQLRDRFGG
ncbi:malonate--CoA ligase [Limimaricola pyoseonensis]|uniref:Malonyl-CoA/methylmalonyl-CoA synthetase n=1 Tax=Limimaricola pyoseonensis TaxID=521013 RepID=A0A1G7KQS4_9RHOB|nr:malonyl-CoA synthase [Limimaricola pyoseonensis]SDF39511.1 malonyl-CoA/methylmalonyl-CoA synthetase [Limimaricola pyoseonensis]